MVEAHPPSRLLRRIVMISVTTGTVLVLLFCGFWFLLPQWAPGVVIRWSPWVEPVVRAGTHLRASGGLGDHGYAYMERFGIWGEDAFPTLDRCLQGPPDLRAMAIDSYQIRLPLGSGGILYDADIYILHLSGTVIHEGRNPWFRVQADNWILPTPLRLHDLRGLDQLREQVARLVDTPGVGRGTRGQPNLMAEVRLDGAIPYGVVSGILAASGYLLDVPTDLTRASCSSLGIFCSAPPASYWDEEERKMLFDPASGKFSHLITVELSNGPDGALLIRLDGKAMAPVDGPPNSAERLHQIRHALGPPRERASGFIPGPLTVIRAASDVAWSDVVAAGSVHHGYRDVMLGHPLDRPETTNPSGDAGGVQGSSSPR